MGRSGIYHVNSDQIIVQSNSISTSQSENGIINEEITNFHEDVINFFFIYLILIPIEFNFRKLPKGSSKLLY